MKNNIELLDALYGEQLLAMLREDDLRPFYVSKLPDSMVNLRLLFKSDLVLAGIPFVVVLLKRVGVILEDILSYEGQFFKQGQEIALLLPFSVAISCERIILNLLSRASSVATITHLLVHRAAPFNIKILDTRKSMLGIRWLDKYAVRVGGGENHRFGQSDLWMVKDNHKKFWGGIGRAVQFFQSMGVFYNQIIVEIHNVQELQEARDLHIKYIMLDNFSPEEIKAMDLSSFQVEISGGINLSNIDSYLIDGVDAISTSLLTNPPAVDLSLKIV